MTIWSFRQRCRCEILQVKSSKPPATHPERPWIARVPKLTTPVWRLVVPMVIVLCVTDFVRADAIDAPNADTSNSSDSTRSAAATDTVKSSANDPLETVTVESRAPARDEKPYRNLIKAMTVFDQNRQMAPQAVIRFRVLPWHDESVMHGLTLRLHSKTVDRILPLADDGSFELNRDPVAIAEDAVVISNRPPSSLAWRPDIRTPGLPVNTRRLGDLRLECKVDLLGTGAGLVAALKDTTFWALAAVGNPCTSTLVHYSYFSDVPVFGVSMVAGDRRRDLPSFFVNGFSAPATSPLFKWFDMFDHLRERLFCVDIQDSSWGDDTLIVLEPIKAANEATETTP
jgi:hypothetical protein